MAPSYCLLAPVSEAVFGVLQGDATLSSLLPGGVQTDVPEDPSYPFLWVEILEQQQFGGFGTKPGAGALPELEIRLHVFSQFPGWAQAQTIVARAIALVADPPAVS